MPIDFRDRKFFEPDGSLIPHLYIKNTYDTSETCSTYPGKQVKQTKLEFYFNDNDGDSACDAVGHDDVTKGYGSVIHELLHAIGMNTF